MDIPIFATYFSTGLAPRFPTLIVSGFIAMAALLALFAGLVLSTLVEKEKQEFEFHLQLVNMQKKRRFNDEDV